MTASQAKLAATGARAFTIARTAETVSLDLLRAVDGTVDALAGVTKVVSGFVSLLSGIAAEVAASEVVEGEYLDPDDKAIDTLERAAGELKDYLTRLVRGKAAIDGDPRLSNHHCEALHDAYEAAMNAVAELVEALQTARAAIITHDLKAEPRDSESFTTASSLIASLRGQ
jgi:hypothetical protein